MVIRVGCGDACMVDAVEPAVEKVGVVLVVCTGVAGANTILELGPGAELTAGDDTDVGAVVLCEVATPPEPTGVGKLNLPGR